MTRPSRPPTQPRTECDRARRKGGLLIVAGAVVLLAAAISVASGRTDGQTARLAASPRSHRTRSESSIPARTPSSIRFLSAAAPTEIASGRSGVWVVSPQDETRDPNRPRDENGAPNDSNRTTRRSTSSSAKRPSGCSSRARRRSAAVQHALAASIRSSTASSRSRSGQDRSDSAPVLSRASPPHTAKIWVVSPSPRVAVSRIDETTQKVSAHVHGQRSPTLASTAEPQVVSRAHPESRPGRARSGSEAMRGDPDRARSPQRRCDGSARPSASRRRSPLAKDRSGWWRDPAFAAVPRRRSAPAR